MGLLLNCVVIFVTVFVKSVDAIQCYECSGQSGIPGLPETEPNCFDPFNSEGITPTECSGQCFANYTSASFGGLSIQHVQRGCITNPAEDCLPSAFCQDVPAPDGSGIGRYCSYCCGDEMCNSQGLEESSADGTSCWHCQVNITESMEITPGSCSSGDFIGGAPPDVFPLPCQGMCVVANVPAGLLGESAQFLRTCDQFGLCAPGGPPPGFENIDFKCCEGDRCNVGSMDNGEAGEGTTPRTVITTMEPGEAGGGEITTPDDTILCYECTGSSGVPGLPDTGANCFDPFNPEGTATTECAGQCFANSTSVSSQGLNIQQVHRGCITDPFGCLLPAFCQYFESGESGFCSYCCDDDMCNSEGLEEAAASLSSCWACQVNITESMEVTPGSCASDDFIGGASPDVLSVPCQGMCLEANLPAMFGEPPIFIRSCDQFGFCVPGSPLPPGFENVDFKCCEGDKCNVGGMYYGTTTTEPGGTEITTLSGDTRSTEGVSRGTSGPPANMAVKQRKNGRKITRNKERKTV